MTCFGKTCVCKTKKQNKKKIKRRQRLDYIFSDSLKDGPLRITEPGTYFIMENIEFEFNKPAKHSGFIDPNGIGNWYPKYTQNDMYPGAGTYRDPWSHGFFAGITIETDNVIIEMNGFEIKQSKAFYYQQRFFALICISNQPFLPGFVKFFIFYFFEFCVLFAVFFKLTWNVVSTLYKKNETQHT